MKKLELNHKNTAILSGIKLVLSTTLALSIVGCSSSNKVDQISAEKPLVESEQIVQEEVQNAEPKQIDFEQVEKDIAATVNEYTSKKEVESDYNPQFDGQIIGYLNNDAEYIKTFSTEELSNVIYQANTLAYYDLAVDRELSQFWTDMLKEEASIERFDTEVAGVINAAENTNDYSEILRITEEYKAQPKHNDPFKNIQIVIFHAYMSDTDFNVTKPTFDKLQEMFGIILAEDLTISSAQDYTKPFSRRA